MKVRVSVTRTILERSKMCGFIPGKIIQNCMLQLAFSDLFPDSVVLPDRVYLIGGFGNTKDRVNLPEIAVNNRAIFDSLPATKRVLMQPFSFEIEVPEYVIERIGVSQIYKVLSESSTVQMVM